ncbi:hypothetical protein NOR53_2365 [gamma proteobacterium NOR5-3]|nr:hypothetical protein NOR53_2365 [gamma proteobacterium NOR5-3]
MSIDYRFVSQGTVVRSVIPCTIFLDVGSTKSAHVFDHHQTGSRDKSTASLVLVESERLLDAIAQCSSVEVFTHYLPDLDSIVATWLARQILAGESPKNSFFEALAAYADRIDQGETYLSSPEFVSLYSLLNLDLREVCRDHIDIDAESLKRLRSGHAVLDTLNDIGCTDFERVPAEVDPELWTATARALRDDFERYKSDLMASERFEAFLPCRKAPRRQPVHAVCVREPTARLFKAWARGDPTLGPGPLLMVGLSSTRVVFSVPPNAGVNLVGLGDKLQALEDETRAATGTLCSGDNRPGYSSPDPWYDGRGTEHNHTIVDSPRSGTLLKWDALKGVLERYSGC